MLFESSAEDVAIGVSVQVEGARFVSDVTPVVGDRDQWSGEVMADASDDFFRSRRKGQT